MEIKRNDATRNRPDGDRVIDANYVFVDIPAFVDQLTSEKAWEKNDRNGITVFKSSNLTQVISALQTGAEIKENSVAGYLTIQVLHGHIAVTTMDGDVQLKDHNIITFHPDVKHSMRAEADTIILLTTAFPISKTDD